MGDSLVAMITKLEIGIDWQVGLGLGLEFGVDSYLAWSRLTALWQAFTPRFRSRSILTTHLTQPANSSLSDQLPDFGHGGQIPGELASEPLRPTKSLAFRSGLGVDRGSCAGITPGCHGWRKVYNSTTSSVTAVNDPWLLLRKRHQGSVRWGIRLIVHGRSGGVVPGCLLSLAEEVEKRRGASAQIEALTAEVSPEPVLRRNWLVPLLLLPGSHARDDVPVIRKRLQAQGLRTCRLPFLGSWPAWWLLLQQVVEQQDLSRGEPVLVHHPLRSGRGDRFLPRLEKQLGIPAVSAEDWQAYQAASLRPCQPLPLALAPNRMSLALREAGGMPPLLEIEAVRLGLIELLTALP